MRGTLPASLRRRISPIGRKVLEAAWATLPDDGVMPRLILSSRHGEYDRTLGLLSELAHSGEVSPAEFSLSVHHALAGLLSIATNNSAGHAAISAGPETFACAMLEAAACLGESDEPVLLMHFDEVLPEIYATVAGETQAEKAVALALLLLPEDADDGELFTFDMAPAPELGTDPLALRFADLLTSGAESAFGNGPRMSWRWHRAA